jgi:hypothetical protein
MTAQDIRWIQRFNHFNKAFSSHIISAIFSIYFKEFESLQIKLDKLKKEEQA